MAIIKCPDCGKEISESAPSCIGCGRPMAVSGEAKPILLRGIKKAADF